MTALNRSRYLATRSELRRAAALILVGAGVEPRAIRIGFANRMNYAYGTARLTRSGVAIVRISGPNWYRLTCAGREAVLRHELAHIVVCARGLRVYGTSHGGAFADVVRELGETRSFGGSIWPGYLVDGGLDDQAPELMYRPTPPPAAALDDLVAAEFGAFMDRDGDIADVVFASDARAERFASAAVDAGFDVDRDGRRVLVDGAVNAAA